MPKPLKPHEKEYQIYALIDPRNNSIRYIGMSADTNYRFYLHIQQGGGKQESAWLRELRQLNLSPILKILETVDPNDYSTACEREKYWMQRLQEAGCLLVNVFGTKRAYHSYSPLRANKKPSSSQDRETTVVALPLPFVAVRKRTDIQPTSVATEKYDFEKLLRAYPNNPIKQGRRLRRYLRYHASTCSVW